MKKIKLPRKQKKAFIKKFGRNAYHNDYLWYTIFKANPRLLSDTLTLASTKEESVLKESEFTIIDEYHNLPRKKPAYVTMSLDEVIENLEE